MTDLKNIEKDLDETLKRLEMLPNLAAIDVGVGWLRALEALLEDGTISVEVGERMRKLSAQNTVEFYTLRRQVLDGED